MVLPFVLCVRVNVVVVGNCVRHIFCVSGNMCRLVSECYLMEVGV